MSAGSMRGARGGRARGLRASAAASRRSAATVLPGLLLFGVTANALAVLISLGASWVTGASLSVPIFIGLLVVTARLIAVAAAGAELAASLRLQHGELTRTARILDTPPLPVLDLPATRGSSGSAGSAAAG